MELSIQDWANTGYSGEDQIPFSGIGLFTSISVGQFMCAQCLYLRIKVTIQRSGWCPELLFLIVVLLNSTILTRVYPNSSVLWKVFH